MTTEGRQLDEAGALIRNMQSAALRLLGTLTMCYNERENATPEIKEALIDLSYSLDDCLRHSADLRCYIEEMKGEHNDD